MPRSDLARSPSVKRWSSSAPGTEEMLGSSEPAHALDSWPSHRGSNPSDAQSRVSGAHGVGRLYLPHWSGTPSTSSAVSGPRAAMATGTSPALLVDGSCGIDT